MTVSAAASPCGGGPGALVAAFFVTVIEEPRHGIVTEFAATRDSEESKSGRQASSALARAVRSEWGRGTREPSCLTSWTQREPVHPRFLQSIAITSVSRPRNSSGNGAGLSRRAPPDGATAPLPCRGFSPRLLLSRAWEEAFTTRALASEASGGFCIERRPPAPRSWARDPVAGPLGTPHRAKALVRRPREREPCKPHRCP